MAHVSAASSDDSRGDARDESRTDLSITSETSLSFGKYRLTRLLARGGMGEVYLARLVGELGFEKRLVIKTILPHLAAKPRFVEMFAAEAKTAVALSHGNIVPIYELGRAGDIFYIVMGHVDGPSVSTILDAYRAGERVPELGIALHIVRGVLTGLAYAHTPEPGRHAVVHRDITPRNVLVDRSGQVRIVDFGIAAPVDAEVDMRGGSTGYASPEQIRGDTVDPRADVFSTACLLYELVTLERAFPKDGVWMQPDLDGVPDELKKPLADAMSIDPAGRPADAHELLERLAPAFARHAGMVGDSQLAAHLRALFPEGWDSHSQPAVAGVAGKQGKRPETHTFATRLTLVTQSLPIDRAAAPAAAQGSAPKRWWLLGLVGALAVAAGAWALGGDRRRDVEPAVAKSERAQAPAPAAPEPATPVVAEPAKPEPVEPEPTAKPEPVEPEPAATPEPAQPEAKPEPPQPEAKPEAKPEATPAVAASKPAKKKNGFLKVTASRVEWAEVRVDGKKKGHTPAASIALPEGTHTVVVTCTDACTTKEVLLSRKVTIEAGKTLELRAN